MGVSGPSLLIESTDSMVAYLHHTLVVKRVGVVCDLHLNIFLIGVGGGGL